MDRKLRNPKKFLTEQEIAELFENLTDDSDADPNYEEEDVESTTLRYPHDHYVPNARSKSPTLSVHNDDCSNVCGNKNCNNEIFAACIFCSNLLCFPHFDTNDDCHNHSITVQSESNACESQYRMEGSRREGPPPNKKARFNKFKGKKTSRNSGQGYIQYKSCNLVPPKSIKSRCKGTPCSRVNKKCEYFTDEERQIIFDSYYKLEDLTLQREYVARFVKKEEKKRSVTSNPNSRRENTVVYTLPLLGKPEPVCKTFFLNTQAITDKTVRTVLDKIQPSGVLEKDKRGGRHASLVEQDQKMREKIIEHINRFDRVESHYVRADSSREYLHEDLNLEKMYRMFKAENEGSIASIGTYTKVFKEMNLSFHRPKKDLCSLCTTYREGDEAVKQKLGKKYNEHIIEKTKVREIKENIKNIAKENSEQGIAVFDLQQVIYLPRSKESAIFYKRRLAVYNFTVYNVASRDCHCFTWHEGLSRRGSSEIATNVYTYLKLCSERGIKFMNLFSDGCSGQNKNTIIVAMMLYAVANLKIEELTLRFFEPHHGQSEGDSAHSCIGYAINHAGDLFLPSQLVPVMRLARNNHPYIVHQLESDDFLDFKGLSHKLRILQTRIDNESGEPINWTTVSEIKVNEQNLDTIFFKTSHVQESYRSITLKSRAYTSTIKKTLEPLNKELPKISKDNFKDLVSLCEGDLPVIRNAEYVNFYKNLPHAE